MTCPNGHTFRGWSRITNGYFEPCRCDQCGVEVPVERTPPEAPRFYGDRRFAGEEAFSVTEGFRPYEVPLARKHITAGRIHDDGRVEFASRSDQRKFMQQLAQLQAGLMAVLPHDV
jgi:hypothetical protein